MYCSGFLIVECRADSSTTISHPKYICMPCNAAVAKVRPWITDIACASPHVETGHSWYHRLILCPRARLVPSAASIEDRLTDLEHTLDTRLSELDQRMTGLEELVSKVVQFARKDQVMAPVAGCTR